MMRPISRACVASGWRCTLRNVSCHRRSLAPIVLRDTCRNHSDSGSGGQASHEYEGYDIDVLDAPLHSIPLPTSAQSPQRTDKEEVLAKARVVFGSRLAGPAQRKADIESKSHYIGGILVPQRPTEPDNCCMSGCVNCVWDRYRDEIEEWAARSAEARMKLQELRTQGRATGLMNAEPGMPRRALTSMNDDGRGTESSGTAGGSDEALSPSGADLFADIPVGIREFMKTEKKLKEKHKREHAMAG